MGIMYETKEVLDKSMIKEYISPSAVLHTLHTMLIKLDDRQNLYCCYAHKVFILMHMMHELWRVGPNKNRMYVSLSVVLPILHAIVVYMYNDNSLPGELLVLLYSVNSMSRRARVIFSDYITADNDVGMELPGGLGGQSVAGW